MRINYLNYLNKTKAISLHNTIKCINYFIMQKFLSLPHQTETNQIVSKNGVIIVEQASTTTTTIFYGTNG